MNEKVFETPWVDTAIPLLVRRIPLDVTFWYRGQRYCCPVEHIEATNTYRFLLPPELGPSADAND